MDKDKRLIELCLKNDRLAQRQMYQRFFPKMVAVCQRYVKNEQDALEMYNSGMLTVLTKLASFKFEGSFEGWVCRIMVNGCLNFIKSSKKYKQYFAYTVELDDKEVAGKESEVLGNIDAEHLHYYLNSLPEVHYLVFNLYAIEGFSHEEIALQLNITAGTSRWYLSKARDILREKIGRVEKYNSAG